jgi:hypothetical protein
MEQAVVLKKEHGRAEADIEAIGRHVTMMGGALVDRRKVLGLHAKHDATAHRLNEILTEIHDMGVQVKDLDVGLIDFPTLYRGEEALLCWKLGEEGIRYWHGVTEGFGGRKQIDADFLDNHRGDKSN